MSSLAHFLLKKNFKVSGCDAHFSENIKKLEQEGLVFCGNHSTEHVEDIDILVYSSAILDSHPEIKRAREKGKIVLKRIELLSEILKLKKSIAVIGSHGKTTTTSFIAHSMKKLGIPSIAIVGGILKNGEPIDGYSETVSNFSDTRKTDEIFAVAEIDESDEGFQNISPFFAVITNIDEEHIDKWGSFENLKNSILNFANSVPIWGSVIANSDDPGIKSIIPKIKKKFITCSVSGVLSGADIVAENIRFTPNAVFDLGIKIESFKSKFHDFSGEYFFVINVKLGLTGIHNVSNSLLAFGTLLTVSDFVGEIDIRIFSDILSDFEGVKRRMELRSIKNGVYVIDDYAHHPSEIKATIQGLKNIYKGGKIVVVFEPHRFSRVAYLKEKFREVLENYADYTIVTDIYPASEENLWNVSPYDIIGQSKKMEYVDFSSLIRRLSQILPTLNQGDVLVFMGAGSIKKLVDEFCAM